MREATVSVDFTVSIPDYMTTDQVTFGIQVCQVRVDGQDKKGEYVEGVGKCLSYCTQENPE